MPTGDIKRYHTAASQPAKLYLNVSCFFFPSCFSLPALTQLLGGFTPRDLLENKKKKRGHRCLSFSPPVRAFVSTAHRVHSAFSLSASFGRRRLASNFA